MSKNISNFIVITILALTASSSVQAAPKTQTPSEIFKNIAEVNKLIFQELIKKYGNGNGLEEDELKVAFSKNPELFVTNNKCNSCEIKSSYKGAEIEFEALAENIPISHAAGTVKIKIPKEFLAKP